MKFAAAALIATTYAVKLTNDEPTATTTETPAETPIVDIVAEEAAYHIDENGDQVIDVNEWGSLVGLVSDANVELGLGLTEADAEAAWDFFYDGSTCWFEEEDMVCTFLVENFVTDFAATLDSTDFSPFVAKIADILEDLPETMIIDAVAEEAAHHIDDDGNDVIDINEFGAMVQWVSDANVELDLGFTEADEDAAWDFFVAGSVCSGEGEDMACEYLVEDFKTDFAATLASTEFSPFVAKIADLFDEGEGDATGEDDTTGEGEGTGEGLAQKKVPNFAQITQGGH